MVGIAKQLWRLGFPITLGRIGVIGMGITDLIVVGQLAGDELPHLSLALTPIGVLLHGGIALLLGVQVISARARGAGDPALAGRAWRRGLVLSVSAGTGILAVVAALGDAFFSSLGVSPTLVPLAGRLATLLSLSIPFHLVFIATTSFLEGLGRPTPGAVAMWIAIGLNLLLDLALVPMLGSAGSAWTTVASRLFLASVLVGYVLYDRDLREYLAPSTSTVSYRVLVRIGLAATVSSVVEAGAFSAMGIIAARISGDALATVNVATGGLLSLLAMIALGLGSASAVLVAQAVGRGDREAVRRVGWTAIGTNALVFLTLGVVCVAAAQPIASAFTSNESIARLFAGTMWMVAILFTPDCGQMVVDPSLRATGDNWLPTAIRIGAFVGVAPALALWLVEVRGLGVEGVFAALIGGSGLAWLGLVARWAWRTVPGNAPADGAG